MWAVTERDKDLNRRLQEGKSSPSTKYVGSYMEVTSSGGTVGVRHHGTPLLVGGRLGSESPHSKRLLLGEPESCVNAMLSCVLSYPSYNIFVMIAQTTSKVTNRYEIA